MAVNLFSSTGALQFRPCESIVDTVLAERVHLVRPALPDEIIDPPPRPDSWYARSNQLWTGLLFVLAFGLLQAAILMPPVFMAKVMF